MQRIDGGYVYEIGGAIHALKQFRYKDVPAYEFWEPLVRARQRVTEFLYQSVFSGSLRSVYPSGAAFLAATERLIERMRTENLETLTVVETASFFEAYDKFEPVLASELSISPLYLTQPKGAYDIPVLVDSGQRLFPPSLEQKVPEAIVDAQQGAKALAFDLFTAAAFHFHRANESVLRRYFDHVAGAENRPTMITMGTLLGELKKLKKGDEQVIASLDCLKKFHRNEIVHPGEQLKDVDEALSLIAAIHAAMGYMLADLPEPMTLPLGDTPNWVDAAAKLAGPASE